MSVLIFFLQIFVLPGNTYARREGIDAPVEVNNIQDYIYQGVSIVVQQKQIQLVFMRIRVQSLALLSGSGIQPCSKVWCRLQMQLRSCVAVAVMQASSCSATSTPRLGTSICCGCGPKKAKTEEEKKISTQQERN